MYRLLSFTIVLTIGLISQVSAQHVYPIKFDNCYLDQFKFETDEIVAKIDTKTIIETITKGWTSKMKKEAIGDLGLQVLVDKRGNSCLVSVRNDTNLKLKKMKLNGNIDNVLQWPRQVDKISTLILLQFEDGEISVKRLGTVDKVNLTEIKNNKPL